MNIKEKLKSTVNKNMMLELIIASIFLIIAAIFSILCLYEKNHIPYGVVADIINAIFDGIAWGFFVIIPAFIGLVIIIFSIISRLVFSLENKKRLMAYRIITGFLLFLMLIICLQYSWIFINDFSGIFFTVTAIIFDILVITVSVIVIKNTYSSRILN